MAVGPGVRAYGENAVGVSSLLMCDEGGGGCDRPGGGLDVVLRPLATSSTLFGAGGGAGSSFRRAIKFEVFRGSGAFDGGAAAGVGEGREGDAPYALSKYPGCGARVGVSTRLGFGTRGGPLFSAALGLGTRGGPDSTKFGFGTRGGPSTGLGLCMRFSATLASTRFGFGTRPGILAMRRSSTGVVTICGSLILSRMPSLMLSLTVSLMGVSREINSLICSRWSIGCVVTGV